MASTETARPIEIYKTRIMQEMDRQTRSWETVKLAREALQPRPGSPPLEPRDLVQAARVLGYRLEPDDEAHLCNDWGNENGRGWFGDVFDHILDGFRSAIQQVGENGPYLDSWWIEGAIAAGAECRVVQAGDKVGLFVLTCFPPPHAVRPRQGK